MNNKCLSIKNRCEYEKIKEEYNNLYGFDMGIFEHRVIKPKNDLGVSGLKNEIKLKKG